ncbi:uncharacterized protein LOC108222654 [Daucus carota subsp. sativus]|uniref:uncharacterized protein LOC108222654 n=1 Tax=Daucus carota subsp. sativus TaxID=79200 RepID=UPI003082F22A
MCFGVIGMEAHDHLSALDDSKTSWTLKVRVTRIWQTRYGNGFVDRHNLILLDCLDNQILAIVNPDLWQRFSNVLMEGRIYTIVNVLVRNATVDFRPVPNSKMILLTNFTSITPHVHDTGMIARHKFNYKTLQELDYLVGRDGQENYHALSVDVIGLLENLQPLERVQGKESLIDVVKFRISDGSILRNVYKWGPMIEELNQVINGVVERPVVVVLAGFKVSRDIDGNARLSSMESSRIYVNLNHQDVFSFRNRHN